MEPSRRTRGGSFHEEFDSIGSEPPKLANRHQLEGEMRFITPYFDHSYMPEPLDPSQLEDDLEDELEEEELLYTRGRSRSRSIHSDESPPVVSDSPQTPVKTAPIPIPIPPSNPHKATTEKVERTGPLHSREVLALQKGLEEANLEVDKSKLLEDEEERLDAETEKRERELVSQNTINHSQLFSTSPPPAPATSAASSLGSSSTLSSSPLLSSDQNMKRVKLLLLGDSGVGKSSLILRWTEDCFNPSLVGTVGVTFKTKRVNIGGDYISVQVWDTAGQEQFHKITTSYYRGVQGIMLIYDISDRKSLENVEYWVKNIKEHASDSVHVALIGNKVDLRAVPDMASKCCDGQVGHDLAARFCVPYFETSAKDSNHVDTAFMTLTKNILSAEYSKTHGGRRSLIADKGGEKEKGDKEKGEKNGILGHLKDRSKSITKLTHSNSGGVSNSNNVAGSPGDSMSPDGKEKCIIS